MKKVSIYLVVFFVVFFNVLLSQSRCAFKVVQINKIDCTRMKGVGAII